LRFNWPAEKARLQKELLSGCCRFEPLSRVTNSQGEALHVWSARDALVLKALTVVLAKRLPVSRRCVHVKGHGGAKAAVRQVWAKLPENAFVFRTDVRAFRVGGARAELPFLRPLDQTARRVFP
jgi:hypothetical protein